MQLSTWKMLDIFLLKFRLQQEAICNTQVTLSPDKQPSVVLVQNLPVVLLPPWNTVAIEVSVRNCTKTVPLNVLIRICQAYFDWKQFMTQWTYFWP